MTCMKTFGKPQRAKQKWVASVIHLSPAIKGCGYVVDRVYYIKATELGEQYLSLFIESLRTTRGISYLYVSHGLLHVFYSKVTVVVVVVV